MYFKTGPGRAEGGRWGLPPVTAAPCLRPRGHRRLIAMLKPRENRRLRVLIVDDYPIARRMFATGLSAYGVDTCEAGDVAEALAVAAEQSPDVVVLDVFLGATSGLEGARALRARGGGGRVPLIAPSPHRGGGGRPPPRPP